MMLRRKIGDKGWLATVYWSGGIATIQDMVAKHGHACTYDGNSKDGWYVYLRDANGIGIDISPWFGSENGDRLRDLKAAFGRCYGPEIKLTRGRNFW